MGKIVNRSGLAEVFEVSLPTVTAWVREGMPFVERGGQGKPWQFDTAECIEWVHKRSEPKPESLSPAPFLDDLAIPMGELLPWLHPDVVTFSEYAEQSGFSPDELLEFVVYGLPVLPPKNGEEQARVSVPHADRWRFLFSVLIEGLGGDALAQNLAAEARKIRGLPRA